MPSAPERTKYLKAGSQASPLDELTKHRRFNAAIARNLHSDPLTSDTALAIANCSQRLSLQFELKGEGLSNPSLVNGMLCNRRLCPFCEWRRTRVWRARLIQGLQSHSSENPKASAIFLTLTMKNCHLHELRDTIKHLHSSFKRLTLIKGFPSSTWFRRTEVTIGKNRGKLDSFVAPQVHPHIHALLLVRPSYWSREYWSQLRWQQEWQMAARLNYTPVVDIRRARANKKTRNNEIDSNLAATLEAAKYSTKASELIGLGNELSLFHLEMKSLRLYGVSSRLRKYIDPKEIGTEELLDTNREPEGQSFTAVAKWFDSIQEYQFIL